MPASWLGTPVIGEQTLGLYLTFGDGVGGATGNCGVASNCFADEVENFFVRGYNNPGTGDDALDTCIGIGYRDVMFAYVWGMTASGSEYKIGTVAAGHPDAGTDILCSPYDQRQFEALASSADTHVTAFNAAVMSRAKYLRRPIVYQGSPIYTQPATNAALDAAMASALYLGADLGLDASGECSRASATLPVVALANRAAAQGIRIVTEAWGRTDTADSASWLDASTAMAATGGNGDDLAFRADTAWKNTGGVWQTPTIIAGRNASPIVIIAYNGNSAALRMQYIRTWLRRGCSVRFDPIGFTRSQLEILLEDLRLMQRPPGGMVYLSRRVKSKRRSSTYIG